MITIPIFILSIVIALLVGYLIHSLAISTKVDKKRIITIKDVQSATISNLITPQIAEELDNIHEKIFDCADHGNVCLFYSKENKDKYVIAKSMLIMQMLGYKILEMDDKYMISWETVSYGNN